MEFKFLTRDTFCDYMKEFGDLYTLCFNVQMEEKEVEWRYMKNQGAEILSCVALDNGKLVANYSASPIQLIRNGEILKIAQSLNTMTHPDYMGQGLFVQLANNVYEYMSDNGYKMIMGFPNNLSNRTFLTKLSWKDICVVPTLEMDLQNVRYKNTEKTYAIIQDDTFELDYSECIYMDENIISVYKDDNYLKWRYAMCPSTRYYNFAIANVDGKASSRIILKEFRNRINIVDTYFSNQDEEKALINYAISFGLNRKKDLLTLWAKLGSREHLLLEGYGFKLASPISYFGGRVFDEKLNPNMVYNANNWCLNMSDDNVY